MYIIPSLYIRDQKSVQVATGGSIYSEDPVEMGKELSAAGAEVLYIIDLNLPPAGISPNQKIIEKLINETGMKVELAGNIRSTDTAERLIHAGVDGIVLGTIAYQKPDFLEKICTSLPGKVSTRIEVVSGKVVIKGWTVAANKSALDYAERFKEAGVTSIFYSDSETEEKLTPSDISRVMEFAKSSPLPIIHTADVTSSSEIDLLLSMESEKIIGIIFGKSMYSGIVDIATTITHAKENSVKGLDEPTLIP